jgi:hypothetical protein
MTLSIKPSQSFEALVKSLHRNRQKLDAPEIIEASRLLDEDNPVLALSPQDFRELLRLQLACILHVRSGVKRATCIHLQWWLSVLDGELGEDEFRAKVAKPWSWAELVALDLHPLLVCCYRRTVKDAELLPAT